MMVPAVAAFAPVTTENARSVSPDPVEVKAKRWYDRRVSPVVADVVPYELEMLPAWVTEIGADEVPPMKPFSEVTGPENVVDAIARILLHELPVSLCNVRQAGRTG